VFIKASFSDVDAQGDQIQNKTCYNDGYTHQEQYIENCNDIDYQTDMNYQNTSSSYQNNFGQLATPLSSLETSRQNSYERDERQYYDVNHYYSGYYPESSPVYDDMNGGDYDDGALFYNSRPFK